MPQSVLYKYLRRNHAEQLISKGVFRIGTLFEFRDIETHGTEIGDSSEGTKSTLYSPEGETWTKGNQPEWGENFVKLGEGSQVSFHGCLMEQEQTSQDYYIYSTTKIFDQNALADFGYDACIIIHHPQKFFNALSRCFRHTGKFFGVFNCQYVNRRQWHEQQNAIHPAILKDPQYEKQVEVRCMWEPQKSKVEAKIIRCPKAAKYCSYYK